MIEKFNFSNEIILQKNRSVIVDCYRTKTILNEIKFIFCSRKLDFKILEHENLIYKHLDINKSINDSIGSIENFKSTEIINFVYIAFTILFSTIFLSLIFYIVRNRLIRNNLALGANKLIFSPDDFIDFNIFKKEINKNQSFIKTNQIQGGKYKVNN